MAEETKTCTTCHETQDIEEFHRNSQFPDGHTYRCRTCTRAYCQRRWRNNIICSSRAADRRRWSADAIANYGAYLTIERVDELLVMQQGQCFYCGVPLMYGTGIDRSTHRAGVTIERADNAVPHVIENCVLACSSCNTAPAQVRGVSTALSRPHIRAHRRPVETCNLSKNNRDQSDQCFHLLPTPPTPMTPTSTSGTA
jgi:hypothetical protein